MKPINITAKELARSDEGLTIVVRRQPSGLYMVAAVSLSTCLPIFRPSFVAKQDIGQAAQQELRMADKCGRSSGLTDSSRHR